MSDLIIPSEIEENLLTNYIGKKVFYFDTLTSTNEIAKNLAKTGAESSSIVIAETQTKGKGRLSRTWESPQGGLWFSIILRPSFLPEQASKITLVTAVSIVQAIREFYNIEAFIKWPNDIFINNKKLCGILTEMNAEIDKINFLIIGIGINVNNDLPEFIKNISINLKSLVGEKDRTDFLKIILHKLENNILEFENKNLTPFLDEIREISYLIGKQIKVNIAGETITGICKDLDKNGNLIIEDINGKIIKVVSGDISL